MEDKKLVDFIIERRAKLLEKNFFNKEFIKNTYCKYFENKVSFFKNMYCRVNRTEDGKNFYCFNTGKYIVELPSSAYYDYDVLYPYNYYSNDCLHIEINEESGYLMIFRYKVDKPRTMEIKDYIIIKEVYVFNKQKFCCKINDSDVEIIENSKLKGFIKQNRFKTKELNKIIDYYGKFVLTKGNAPMYILNEYALGEFLKHKEVMRKESKKQQIIDSINDDNLSFINYSQEKIPVDRYRREFRLQPVSGYYHRDVFVFAKGDVQMTEDGWMVIRGFYEFNIKREEVEIIEAIRFYYKDGTFIKARKCIDNTFITAQGILPEHCVFNIDTQNIAEDVYEKTQLKYYKEIIENTPSSNRMMFLFQLFENPDIEKLYKIGFDSIIKEISETPYVMSNLFYNYMGFPANNSKNILKKYGINSYQAEKITTFMKKDIEGESLADKDARKKVLKYLRDIQNDLSDIDNDSFNNLFRIVAYPMKGNYYLGYYAANLIKKLVQRKGLKTTILRMNQLLDAYEKDTSSRNLYHICSIYEDTIRMSDLLNNYYNENVIKITSIDELYRTHDNMIYIMNQYQKEIYKASFDEKQKKWKKFFFEDDEYLITAPKQSDDLAREGLELHHCVKSYIEAVAEGRTNILFLRKKIDPDKPFFTIEITNDKTIRQIHGFANCNITSDEAAYKFYLKWLKEKDIKNYTSNSALRVE